MGSKAKTLSKNHLAKAEKNVHNIAISSLLYFQSFQIIKNIFLSQKFAFSDFHPYPVTMQVILVLFFP